MSASRRAQSFECGAPVGEFPGVTEGALSFAGAAVARVDAVTVSQNPAKAIMVLNGVDVPSVLII
jgi:hypothetical protein